MATPSPGEQARQLQYQATVEILGQGRTAAQLLALVEQARTLTARLMAAPPGAEPLACAAGCAACCYLQATVAAPEALAIVHRLAERSSQTELDQLKARIRAAYQQTKKLDNLSRATAGLPCPLLTEAGLCRIYEFRPMDCLTHHSLSRTACAALLQQPGQGHPTLPPLPAIGAGLKAGLGQGLVAAGLETPALRYELIEALHLALNESRAMDKYLAGRNVFKSAAIVIDSASRVSYKIKYAPPRLKKYAQEVIARGRSERSECSERSERSERSK